MIMRLRLRLLWLTAFSALFLVAPLASQAMDAYDCPCQATNDHAAKPVLAYDTATVLTANKSGCPAINPCSLLAICAESLAAETAGSRALVPMSENLFANGTGRTVAGYEVYGNSGLVGNTYNVNVLGLYAQDGSQGLRALSSALKAEAQAAGASRISISGNTIINPGISGLSPLPLNALAFNSKT